MMRLFKKKKEETEICMVCGKKLEYDNWNFPIVYDVCRGCTADGIRWSAAQFMKEEILKYKLKEGE